MTNYKYVEYYSATKNNDLKIAAKRLEIANYAIKHGIKPASRVYHVALNTVRKWVERSKESKSVKNLSNRSTRPNNVRKPLDYKVANKIIITVLEFKTKGKLITANNIRKAAKIKDTVCSDGTINRYVRKALDKKSKKVKKGNNKSTKWKENLKPFELIQVDIKYLTDIPNLTHLFRKNKKMPKYQITARDVATGYTWVAFANQKGVFETTKFLRTVIIPFFQKHKLDMSKTIIQTDNGKEFTNKNTKKLTEPKKTIFTKAIEEAFRGHRTIIPGHCTANSDVESFHWTIERDFYGFEDFYSVEDFLRKTKKYINGYTTTIIKNRKASPKQIIQSHLGKIRIAPQNPEIMKYY